MLIICNGSKDEADGRTLEPLEALWGRIDDLIAHLRDQPWAEKTTQP